MPAHLIFTITENQGGQQIIESAGHSPEVDFALPLELFLGKEVREVFSQINQNAAIETTRIISNMLKGVETIEAISYINEKDNKPYDAHFMRMAKSDKSASVNILIYPKR